MYILILLSIITLCILWLVGIRYKYGREFMRYKFTYPNGNILYTGWKPSSDSDYIEWHDMYTTSEPLSVFSVDAGLNGVTAIPAEVLNNLTMQIEYKKSAFIVA